MISFEPLKEPWLVHFHINNYVRPTDHREFNRPVVRGRSNGGLERAIKKAEFSFKPRKDKLDRLIKSLDV